MPVKCKSCSLPLTVMCVCSTCIGSDKCPFTVATEGWFFWNLQNPNRWLKKGLKSWFKADCEQVKRPCCNISKGSIPVWKLLRNRVNQQVTINTYIVTNTSHNRLNHLSMEAFTVGRLWWKGKSMQDILNRRGDIGAFLSDVLNHEQAFEMCKLL